MINERIALVMLDGVITSSDTPDPHYAKRFYKCIQNFANVSLQLFETGKLKKFEQYLKVALKLFREGNETVKGAIVNVFLFKLSGAADRNALIGKEIHHVFPKEVIAVCHRFHFASGV
jgi:hypothetical protein